MFYTAIGSGKMSVEDSKEAVLIILSPSIQYIVLEMHRVLMIYTILLSK